MSEILRLTDDEVDAVRLLASSGLRGNEYLEAMKPLKGDAARAAFRCCRNSWELHALGGDTYELRRKGQTESHPAAVPQTPEAENEIKKKADAWDKLYDQTSKEAK